MALRFADVAAAVNAQRQEAGSTRQEEIKAELLAYNNGPVWRIENEIFTGLRADQYRGRDARHGAAVPRSSRDPLN